MSTNPEKIEGAKPEKKKKNGAPKRIKVSSRLTIVQDVILLMQESQINEIHFEQGDVKVHIRKSGGSPFEAMGSPSGSSVQQSAFLPPQPAPAPVPEAPVKVDAAPTLNSPMVGTFYRAPSPESKPFIEEGDKIAVGQVYCIIEAMKLMNEVKAEVAGKVVKIITQNGQAVEFNQPLIVIDPS